jgi:hypothetical protein
VTVVCNGNQTIGSVGEQDLANARGIEKSSCRSNLPDTPMVAGADPPKGGQKQVEADGGPRKHDELAQCIFELLDLANGGKLSANSIGR